MFSRPRTNRCAANFSLTSKHKNNYQHVRAHPVVDQPGGASHFA